MLGQQIGRTLTSAGGSSGRTMTWDYFPDGKLAARSDDGVPVGLHVVLVDNSDTQNVGFTGAWTRADTADGLFGFDYATSTAGTGADTAQWDLHIPTDGSYEVFARWPQISGAATDATYTVEHDSGSTPVTVDQTTQAGEWVSLGAHTFTEGADADVTLTDDANGTVVADAVKLVRDTTGETDTEAKDLTYEYDVNGNLVDIVDLSSNASVDAYTVAYDGLNRVAQVEELLAGTVRNTTSFTYNRVGAPLTRTHDDNHASFAYDNRNLLTTVTNGDTPSDPDPKTTTYTHTPRGQRATETKANGNTVTFDYWPDGALREQVETKPDATVVASHLYEYDLNGNRSLDTSRQMNADNHADYLERVSTFAYDPRDRLDQVTRTDPGTGAQVSSETYTHDANNNVISQTIDGTTTDSAYDRNRLQATTTAGVVSTFNYDPFGRLDTIAAAGQTSQRYVYDGFDRIIEQTTDGVVTQKAYDPLDRLATETTDAGGPDEETTLFTYLGLTEQVLSEQVGGQVTTSYQHGGGGEMLSQTKHDTTGTGPDEDSFYGYNPHGDITGITDETGNSRATYGYTAYGSDDESLFTGVDTPDPGDPTAQEPYNAYRYAGKRFDTATGTYDMGFRDYDPGLNRFLTRDMFNGALADINLGSNPWTLGRYTFAAGNPTTLVEYDGHAAVRDIDGGGVPDPPPPVLGPPSPEAVALTEEKDRQILPNGTELIILNNGTAFINGFPIPPGGPDPTALAQWVDNYMPGGFAPSPYGVNGEINLKQDPLVATIQRVGGYCNSWHQFADEPTCSEEFAAAITDQLEIFDNYTETGNWFVGVSFCYAVCMSVTYADGAIWASNYFGCCGAGATVGTTTVPASEQAFQNNYQACISYYAGACGYFGDTINGGHYTGQGITFGYKAGLEGGLVISSKVVQIR